MSAVSTHIEDAAYRREQWKASGRSSSIWTTTQVAEGVQLTDVSQVESFVRALRGERESIYAIKVIGDRFVVDIEPSYSGQAAVLSFEKGDWLVMGPREQAPRIIAAKEYSTYWDSKEPVL